MPHELDVKAWLMADRAATHSEIALRLASRGHEHNPLLGELAQMAREMREEADEQFRQIMRRVAHARI